MLTTGANVAGYRIERVLGVDGMSAVYLATNAVVRFVATAIRLTTDRQCPWCTTHSRVQ
jgi:protein-disulfide isomerase